MTTRIIILRHGNNFRKGETPTRVGARTDLPLVETERGTLAGEYLKAVNLIPHQVFAAPLKRTMETARLAIAAVGKSIPLQADESFREVDYGPDENKTDAEIIARIGEEALAKWDSDGVLPQGWTFDPQSIIDTWINLGKKVEQDYKDQNVMVVSSNGIIRFAPYLTGDFDKFKSENAIKVGTGCLCVFEKNDGDKNWTCTLWNLKPKDYFAQQGTK